MMTRIKTVLLMITLMFCAWPVQAEIDSKLFKEFKLGYSPLDIELSLSGQRVFVLDDQGHLRIYNMAGDLTDTITVGKHVDKIKVSSRDDLLFLSSRDTKTLQILSLTYTHNIDISGSPYQGPSNAPVAVVVFSDFQCPYCAKIRAIIDQVRGHYAKEVKSVFKHFPLPSHKFALHAAKASIAADAQGKFWQFHDQLFENYSQIDEKKIEEIRTALNLDKTKFEKVMEAPQTLEKITKDRQEGEQAEVRGTPTVFVNGRMVRPANYENIKEAVEAALKGLKK
ncbi:MAG: hypothetical protein C4519_08490 [Desulfobacteraceae bacterium]|nr:MAG: hypothetical protein C4519_08490 [Desulfobacteraceae bacterium]